MAAPSFSSMPDAVNPGDIFLPLLVLSFPDLLRIPARLFPGPGRVRVLGGTQQIPVIGTGEFYEEIQLVRLTRRQAEDAKPHANRFPMEFLPP